MDKEESKNSIKFEHLVLFGVAICFIYIIVSCFNLDNNVPNAIPSDLILPSSFGNGFVNGAYAMFGKP